MGYSSSIAIFDRRHAMDLDLLAVRSYLAELGYLSQLIFKINFIIFHSASGLLFNKTYHFINL